VAAVVLPGTRPHILEEVFGSVIQDWSLYLLMLPITLVMVALTLLLIRLVAGYVIYVFYGLTILAFLGFGTFMVLPSAPAANTFVLKQNRIVAILIAVASFLVALLIFCIFCAFRERIKMSVNYINQANQFFRLNWQILFMPLILAAVLALFLEFWVFLNFAFYSLNRPSNQPNQLPFQHYNLTLPALLALFFNIFYLLWGVIFLVHSGAFVVAGTTVNWAFRREKSYSAAVKAYFASHMGSVCLGSFLTALLGSIKFELDEADVPLGQCSVRNAR
jgi:hypothetical protein